jgi:hypothetical protein
MHLLENTNNLKESDNNYEIMLHGEKSINLELVFTPTEVKLGLNSNNNI